MGSIKMTFLILIIWMVIVLGGGILQAGNGSLNDFVNQRIVISLIVAPLFLFAMIYLLKWNKQEFGLKRGTNWRLIWLPMLFVLTFFGLAVLLKLPPLQQIAFVGVNTLFVGISEELMFRGIVFSKLFKETKLNIWPVMILTSLIFGGVHTLNGFMTGDFVMALGQAMAATLSGFWMLSLRIRTGSIFPSMLVHALWDFSIFVFGAALSNHYGTDHPQVELSITKQVLVPLLFPMPLFLYGLWLLRGIGKKTKEEISL